jgi:ectoine hydroxylase-related dioxygenase (phytanoyl-CoA dioxygenase family)
MNTMYRYFFLCILSWLVASASTHAFHPLASPGPATPATTRRIPVRSKSSCLRALPIAKDGKPPKRPSSIAKDGKPPKQQRPFSSRKVVDGAAGSANKNNNKNNNNKVQQHQHQRLRRPDLTTQLDYARNGHAVMRHLLDPTLIQNLRGELWKHGTKRELQAWRQKVEVAADSTKRAAACHTVQDCRKELSQLGVPDDYLPFLQFFNNWTSLPSVYHDVVLQLAETAAMLMDVESVRLYQDSLFWKRPGDGPTPWHTDARMAPFDTSNMVTLWIPLQAVPKGGTGLIFCSKSHSDFSLPYWNPLDKADANPLSPWNALEERYHRNDKGNDNDRHLVDYMPLQTGDVTAHAGWTLHCADGNLLAKNGSGGSGGSSSKATKSQSNDRLALAVTYVDARAMVREDALTSSMGDNEDVWSYRDWVPHVPARTRNFVHERVPIVWPRAPL